MESGKGLGNSIFNMVGKKPQPQQEMVQNDQSMPPISASPFWRPRGSHTQRETSRTREPNIVVGASYSHADMLKFDSLNAISSISSRPRTPPASSYSTGRAAGTPPHHGSTITSPPPRTYDDFLSHTNDDWNAEEDDDDEETFGYDDEDEDEFGLPSIASMRRKGKRLANSKGKRPRGGQSTYNGSIGPIIGPGPNRRRANSSDIAEERGPPSYPMTRQSEGKILRPQYKEILRDPANSLHLVNHPPVPANATSKEVEAHSTRISRINKFKRILQASSIPLSDLRDSSWSGIPEELRAMTWQLLLGYLPMSSERRVATLERKRKEYLDGVRQAFERGNSGNQNSVAAGASGSSSAIPTNTGRGRGLDEAIWHQISIDVPRTNPHLELYGYEATQRSLERILYVWAIRHPASGYVQGINDLVTPFWQVFLGCYITDPNIECGMDPGQLPKTVLDAVEADSFWCLTKLLDGIQDNYIFAQPGIQRQVSALRDLTMRIDAGLAKHLEKEGVEFIQFSFRWMNCLLMREVSLKNTIRMWDTYMAEEQGFSEFHLYVCAAFLVKWSGQLVKMDFQEVMMFLQALPTRDWTEKDIELLLSEAFIWQSLFRGSSAHLRNSSSPAIQS
ncbi:MAG: GTPase-activating protein [Geoglossum simile]|nr:MAG: GTPase-activating protein [Geoglossum simile]